MALWEDKGEKQSPAVACDIGESGYESDPTDHVVPLACGCAPLHLCPERTLALQMGGL